MPNNPLNIQEPQLLAYHDEINDLFSLNRLPFESEYYHETNPKLNSSVSYFVEINGVVRGGFVLHVKGKTKKSKGKFGGAVFKVETISYLEKEGFSQEYIENEGPVLAPAPSPKYFFAMLCVPLLEDLDLGDE